MVRRKYDIEFFKALAKEKGGLCLSESYLRLIDKLIWECSNGHVFELSPSKILSRDYWCPECTGRRQRHSLETISAAAEKRGWKFLSLDFKTVMDKYKFQCDNGHIVVMFAANVLKGAGCRTCAGKQLLTIEDFHEIAKERGGECLSEKYIDQQTKLKFRCKNGHEFEATAGSIRHSKSWCKVCAGLELGTIEEMQELAESKGGKCLSKEYINSSTKLEWQCSDNHIWEATPRDVKNNDSWCPYCRWYKQETKCKYILEELLSVDFIKTRQILSGGLELDGYSQEKGIAFEYNGEQHYDTNHFFNYNQEKLRQIRENDNKKRKECKTLGITLIEIPFFEAKSDRDLICYITSALTQHDIEFNNPTKDLLKNFYQNHSVINEIKDFVESKNGKLHSSEYVNHQTKLLIECDEGHQWTTNYTQLKQGVWCTKCSGYAKRTIQDMQQIAADRGGKCLSKKYVNNKTVLRWQCDKGHVWEATPHSIMRGSWCLECSGKKKLTIEDMRILAQQNGGKCLSDNYINNSTPLVWECEYGHKWKARPQDIKNKKSWCPYCSGRLKEKAAANKRS